LGEKENVAYSSVKILKSSRRNRITVLDDSDGVERIGPWSDDMAMLAADGAPELRSPCLEFKMGLSIVCGRFRAIEPWDLEVVVAKRLRWL
jgi:transcriptional regulator of nitric oxide reductase